MAEEHRLPLWRVRASIRLASNRMILTGHSEQLRQAHDTAWAMGAVHTGYEADASLAMHDVFFGRYDEALHVSGECETAMARFGKLGDLRHALVVKAAAHAHQASRPGMEAALAEFDRRGGTGTYYMPIVHGLCRTFCALLEEDRATARAELAAARAFDDERPTIYYQYGRYGLALLLDVLEGTAGRREYEATAAHPAAELRWNRQFVHFTHVVLLGAAGEPGPAAAALAQAREAAAVFPTAHRLGLRLVAESALTHGWGDPTAWLREAELHFRTIGTPLIAAACRTLIRRAGHRAPQRRTGHDRLPTRLRERGVTVREYEVLLLLAERHPTRRSLDACTCPTAPSKSTSPISCARRVSPSGPRSATTQPPCPRPYLDPRCRRRDGAPTDRVGVPVPGRTFTDGAFVGSASPHPSIDKPL